MVMVQTRLWHVTLTVGGPAVPAEGVRAALERLAAEQPFLLSGRYSDNCAEVRYWEEAEDCADACVFLMREYEEPGIVNIGLGEDVTIRELAGLIAEIVGFKGTLRFDATKPDGTPRKLLDVSRLTSLGWRARTGLREGIAETYRWYQEHR